MSYGVFSMMLHLHITVIVTGVITILASGLSSDLVSVFV